MFRVEGVTRAYGDTEMTPHQCEEIAMSLMNERQKAKFAEELEMNLGLFYPEIGRFRVNIFWQKGTISIVFRQIKLEIETIDDLKLPPILKAIAMTNRGLVLVVGGTGTGKSTTLAAMVEERNRSKPGHIITVEDPIEFIYPHRKCIVSQREIGIDTLSYFDALKNAMRQAPDVILIGEIRDRETMESAVVFSETGHLCLSTLHANNANQAFERILNFFPPEKHEQLFFQLSLNMRAVISQRLIPGFDGKRVAAVEILLDTPRVKDLIMKHQTGLLKDAMMESTKEGMQTFDQHIFEFFSAGKISYENAIVYADSANDLRLRIKIDEVSTASAEAREKQADLNDAFRIKADETKHR
jgi:twitching motility protein PilU